MRRNVQVGVGEWLTLRDKVPAVADLDFSGSQIQPPENTSSAIVPDRVRLPEGIRLTYTFFDVTGTALTRSGDGGAMNFMVLELAWLPDYSPNPRVLNSVELGPCQPDEVVTIGGFRALNTSLQVVSMVVPGPATTYSVWYREF